MKLDRYGYGLCCRCLTRRPRTALVEVVFHTGVHESRSEWHCADVGFCTRAAGIAKGELDGGTPRGPELNAEVAGG